MVWLLWLPWLFRGISVLSAIAGLFQGQQVLSGGYSASPWNLGMVFGSFAASAGSWVLSWLTKPTSWETIKTWLDKAFKYVHDKSNIDPENMTDADERGLALLEELLLRLLGEMIKRWAPGPREEANKYLTGLKMCRLVSQSGPASPETLSTLNALSQPAGAK